jgi:hypothetical protein
MPNYFAKMPVVLYDFTIQSDSTEKHLTLADVTSRATLKLSSETEDQVMNNHMIKEWETPRSISEYYYGTGDYYWLIMYLNSIVDIQNDWVKSEFNLVEFCKKKYSASAKEYRPEEVFSMYVEDLDTASFNLTVSTSDLEKIGDIILGSYIELENYLAPDTKVTGINDNILTIDKKPLVITSPDLAVPVLIIPVIEGHLGLHHYEDDVGNVSDITYTNGTMSSVGMSDENEPIYELSVYTASGISNLEYEQRINESKRIIRVVKPDYIVDFIRKFDAASFK